MTIKIIEGMRPWEVMKAADEGNRVAFRGRVMENGRPMPPSEWCEANTSALWDWKTYNYAIIDDSQPIIEWDKFDWEFFNQYGGLFVITEKFGGVLAMDANFSNDNATALQESPFYYWPGGECPVPRDVEVETIYNNAAGGRTEMKSIAKDIHWDDCDIIAFRLTGNVC